MMTPRRACVCGAVDCRRHRKRAWGRQPPERQAMYADPAYRRNRAIAIKREPVCHWCHGRPSRTGDHLVPIARGGTNELSNLVGACGRCNQRRGGAEGRATAKRRAAQRNHRGKESR